jgi:hypothetical protein
MSEYGGVVSGGVVSGGVVSGGVVSGAKTPTTVVDHHRKVEELKRIASDTPPIVENKKKEVRRVFYS